MTGVHYASKWSEVGGWGGNSRDHPHPHQLREKQPGETSVQPSFMGEYRHSIDAKGRLIVPSRLRSPLGGDQLVLSYWLDGGIALWSAEGWQAIQERLLGQGRGSSTARSLLRTIASSAYEDSIDAQGRITVPPQLRQAAGIDRDVVVIGVLDHAEIWAPERFDEMKQAALEPGVLEAAVEELTDF